MKPLVLQRNGIDALREEIPQRTVALVLSDLPSGETHAVFDDKPNLDALWCSIRGALKIDGTVVFMASSLRFASLVIDSAPRRGYDLIWHKSLATGHLNSRTRPLRAHEFILVFPSSANSCYVPQMVEAGTPIHKARRTSHGQNYGSFSKITESRAGAIDRYPTSVLDFASVGTRAKERIHPQQKPRDLMRWLVRTYSRPDDLVVDPFAGSGSTGYAALEEGRRFIGYDVNPKYGRK